jgi:hypothetical protein
LSIFRLFLKEGVSATHRAGLLHSNRRCHLPCLPQEERRGQQRASTIARIARQQAASPPCVKGRSRKRERQDKAHIYSQDENKSNNGNQVSQTAQTAAGRPMPHDRHCRRGNEGRYERQMQEHEINEWRTAILFMCLLYTLSFRMSIPYKSLLKNILPCPEFVLPVVAQCCSHSSHQYASQKGAGTK